MDVQIDGGRGGGGGGDECMDRKEEEDSYDSCVPCWARATIILTIEWVTSDRDIFFASTWRRKRYE